MAKQAVNTGVLPNDGQGDNLRSGAVKINNNFILLKLLRNYNKYLN